MEGFCNRLQVELHVPDFQSVKAFYGRLGFAVLWCVENGDADDYLVMEREGAVLCFWPGNSAVWEQPYFSRFPRATKRGFGVEIVYMVDDVETYYEQVKEFATVVEPLVRRPWGLLDFRLEDPNGYYLRVTEPTDITTGPTAAEPSR
jgi:predicted enzyme related to lactoylglutathione lyase